MGVIATVVALVASLVFQVSGHEFIHRTDVLDTSLRRAIVLTLVFYLVVGGLVVAFVQQTRARLVWHRGGVERALLLGLPLGAVGGLLAVGLNSAAVGHLASDPNVTALVGGGGAARLFLTFVTTAVLAPLVEETIFRGICAGSLLARGTAPAVWLSAVAFAIWHLNPVALRYYAIMGLVFAGIWLKRGLVASISAHAAFNGALTVAAIMATTGAAVTTTLGAVQVTVPGGWHVVAAESDADHTLVAGPAGSILGLLRKPDLDGSSLQVIEDRLATEPVRAGVALDRNSLTETPTSLGTAIAGDFSVANQPGHVLEFAYQGSVYELIIVTAGNPEAEHVWRDVIASLRTA